MTDKQIIDHVASFMLSRSDSCQVQHMLEQHNLSRLYMKINQQVIERLLSPETTNTR